MNGLSGDSSSNYKSLFDEYCYVYVMCFDEEKGHLPLIIFPHEKYQDNKKFMRPIKYHPIWFFQISEQDALDHVDVEYKGYTFIGKKFNTTSKRAKKRAGLKEETPETIIVIVSLPNDLVIFGDDLIRIMTDGIQEKFGNKLFEIIEYLDAKEQIIKTPETKKTLEKGSKLKNDLRTHIEDILSDFFSKAIKRTDNLSVKKQKALSFLALKGIQVSNINNLLGEGSFSTLPIFKPDDKQREDLKGRPCLKILSINLIEDSNELEITIMNDSENEINNMSILINHLEEFFEKEILNQTVEIWFPYEEILFNAPVLPHIKEYLLFVIDGNTNEKLISKKIDVDNINKIKS
ncbi:MAG: hypothetical protein JW891_06740 [Candidatus Lokiarchaeota archaeon]|nr:hypothetical protein [Candidatus Lokiarchaeota archaeon]